MLIKSFLIFSALLAQIAVLALCAVYFNGHFNVFYAVSTFFGIMVALAVIKENTNPSYKIAWLIPVLCFPTFGAVLYIFLSRRSFGFTEYKHSRNFSHKSVGDPPKSLPMCSSPAATLQSRYLFRVTGYSSFTDTDLRYYAHGSEFFKDLKSDLARADHSIYMEYYIISRGRLFGEVLEILTQRASVGVDVRIVCDGIGSMLSFSSAFLKELESKKIKLAVFSPVTPLLSPGINLRDHRKITVIDGNIAYTGGINLSDEYVGYAQRLGKWKDCAVRLCGTGALPFEDEFLDMWEICTEEKNAPREKLSKSPNGLSAKDYVLHPYFTTPHGSESVGENVYLGMINRARHSICIMTPYLILGNEMLTCIKNAAASGVSVRIIIPGIPDKKTVFAVTRSYFAELLASGVEIFEFTPGFVHSKVIIADGEICSVGSMNFDFRSLYLQFECGVWIFGASAVEGICEDFEQTLALCHRIKPENCREKGFFGAVSKHILRCFAPLL